jgi:hypothetical protein
LFRAGDAMVLHSVFDDNEPDRYFTGMEIVFKEKRTFWLRNIMATVSREEWNGDWHPEQSRYSQEEWARMYDKRMERAVYPHLYYIVQKPL